jgi:hypothetical protein
VPEWSGVSRQTSVEINGSLAAYATSEMCEMNGTDVALFIGVRLWLSCNLLLVWRYIMADTISGKLTEAKNAVSEAATKVGNRISEKAEEAKDWAKRQTNKAQNRADEASQKVEDESEVARQDEKAKDDNCNCP